MRCFPQEIDERRNLWTTRPDACGSTRSCEALCGIPGLSLNGASLSTDGWIISTLLNMLMTDAKKPDSACGSNPNGRGGHWSESYITNGPKAIGSQICNIGTAGRVEELRAMLDAHAKEAASRLENRGVATKVEVETEYVGDGRFRLNIIIQGSLSNPSSVGVTAQRVENGWAWING